MPIQGYASLKYELSVSEADLRSQKYRPVLNSLVHDFGFAILKSNERSRTKSIEGMKSGWKKEKGTGNVEEDLLPSQVNMN